MKDTLLINASSPSKYKSIYKKRRTQQYIPLNIGGYYVIKYFENVYERDDKIYFGLWKI